MNIKALFEQREAAITRMNEMVSALESKKTDGTVETRAFTDDEAAEFNRLKGEVTRLTMTINSVTEMRSLPVACAPDDSQTAVEQLEQRAFIDYLRSGELPETRDSNWTKTANGAVIPTSIARKIIEKIKEISPIYGMASHYPIGGTLTIPFDDESTGSVSMAYSEELTDLTGTSSKLSSITLTGFLAGALCKVSKSLLNNSDFDILGYVINKVAQAAVVFIDKELINGTDSKITGLRGVTQNVTAAAQAAVTADELIDLQDMVPDAYQANAVWIMSKKTRSAIRKLKDGEGNYLLNKDATSKWGYTLFGKPVFISDQITDMAAGKRPIYYGDFSGLAIKTTEQVNIEVLRELFAAQHALGVVAWLELDAKVENAQKIASLTMAAAKESGT